jgi:hypothetical protein
MTPPRITDEDRGLTINKSLAWTMLTGIFAGGLWLGVQLTETQSAIQAMQQDAKDRNAEEVVNRREIDARLRTLEQSRVGDASEIAALRRDLNELRPELRELTSLIRGLEARQRSNP